MCVTHTGDFKLVCVTHTGDFKLVCMTHTGDFKLVCVTHTGDFGFGGGVTTLIVALLLRQIAVIESFTQGTAPMCTTLFLSTVLSKDGKKAWICWTVTKTNS